MFLKGVERFGRLTHWFNGKRWCPPKPGVYIRKSSVGFIAHWSYWDGVTFYGGSLTSPEEALRMATTVYGIRSDPVSNPHTDWCGLEEEPK